MNQVELVSNAVTPVSVTTPAPTATKPTPYLTCRLKAIVEVWTPEHHWGPAPDTNYEPGGSSPRWLVHDTPTLLKLLFPHSKQKQAKPAPELIGIHSDQPMFWHPLVRTFYETHKELMEAVSWGKLLELQSYLWHDTITETAWAPKGEGKYIQDTGRPPRQRWEKPKSTQNKERVSWQVPITQHCGDFVQRFIPEMRELTTDPEHVRAIFFLYRANLFKKDPEKKRGFLEELEEEETWTATQTRTR